jgi:hypothetical protein
MRREGDKKRRISLLHLFPWVSRVTFIVPQTRWSSHSQGPLEGGWLGLSGAIKRGGSWNILLYLFPWVSRVTFIVPQTSFFQWVNQIKALVYARGTVHSNTKKKKENQGMTLVKTRDLKHQGVTLVLPNNHGDYAYNLRWSHQQQGPIEGTVGLPKGRWGGGGGLNGRRVVEGLDAWNSMKMGWRVAKKLHPGALKTVAKSSENPPTLLSTTCYSEGRIWPVATPIMAE